MRDSVNASRLPGQFGTYRFDFDYRDSYRTAAEYQPRPSGWWFVTSAGIPMRLRVRVRASPVYQPVELDALALGISVNGRTAGCQRLRRAFAVWLRAGLTLVTTTFCLLDGHAVCAAALDLFSHSIAG
jgi:hypothetical protein